MAERFKSYKFVIFAALFTVAAGLFFLPHYFATPEKETFPITIVKTEKEMIEAHRLYLESMRRTYADFMSTTELKEHLDPTLPENQLSYLLEGAEGIGTHFAAAKNRQGKMVGFVLTKPLDEKTIFVDLLFVDYDYQRKGIGTRLIQATIDAFPEAKYVHLGVFKTNKPAQKFYEKQGFVFTGITDDKRYYLIKKIHRRKP
jgi:ribosomal protein S18 acetylase RimI-like enzyme